MDPATGDAYDVPATFRSFHNQILGDDAEEAVAVSAFQSWAFENEDKLPLKPNECVGFKVPLFICREDEFDNYEATYIEVYWSLNAQILAQIAGLPAGTPIRGVRIE